MDNNHKPIPGQDPLAFLSGGGEMGERTRTFDWAKTPVGAASDWPQSLRSALSICLNSNFPIALYWGGDLVLLYNDEWSPILGEKHPWALGRPAQEVWPEIWHIIEPLFRRVLTNGEPTRQRDQLLPMHRHGFTEECYFDYTFSPIRGERGAIEGVFNAVIETTNRIVGERHLRTLRDLGRTAASAKSADEACGFAARTLADNPHDVPFVLIYLLDAEGREARLTATTGVEAGGSAAPERIDMSEAAAGWPLRRVYVTAAVELVTNLPARFGNLPGGPWPERSEAALVLPIAAPGQARPTGFLVAGLNPRRVVDAEYRGFFDLVAGNIGTAVANARAYEEERRRAQALAELDRAKTAFFSNVSHEFRTPLTLMLGPIEELLARSHTDLPPAAASQLEVANRNGLRLLRLVNTLLDFSRIEAGRVRAVYQPTDLAGFTAELASVFRAAVEKARLRLVVDCPKLTEPVFVDREMWEKIVLNLLSNAFKFTFEGEIAVALRRNGANAELRVQDTGTGIPAEEMPRLFERFHRVENAKGRTHEGSGIGLALVQELVTLHGGAVAAQSVVGKGTTFIVTLPLGSAHLPPNQIEQNRDLTPTAIGAAPYVEEALRWLPDEQHAEDASGAFLPDYYEPLAVPCPQLDQNDDRPRVLVADDNADMRQYLARLLAGRYTVETAPDGEAALAAARERPPDLILTDVMMPRLDGFGLLKALRADPAIRGLPVIMLSARAGEESRVEGMDAGADDYLVKPFSARELLARVSAHLQMAQLRRDAGESLRRSEEQFRLAAEAVNGIIYEYDLQTDRVERMRGLYEVLGYRPDEVPATVSWWIEQVHPEDREKLSGVNPQSIRESEGMTEYQVRHKDGRWLHVEDRFVLLRDDKGAFVKAVGCTVDVTERKQVEEQTRRRESFISGVLGSITDAFFAVDKDWRFSFVNDEIVRRFGRPREKIVGEHLWEMFADAVGNEAYVQLHRAMADRVVVEYEVFYERWQRWFLDKAFPTDDGGLAVYTQDVTEKRRADEQLRQAQRERAAELEAMTRLHALSTRLLAADDLAAALDDLLENAILACGADFGNIQLYTPQSKALEIVVQRGFRQDFLDYFRVVRIDEGSCCAQAMQSGERMVIEDVNLDPAYEPHRGAAAAAGYRGVQSTPLKNRSGAVIGMLSIHFRAPHRPSERDEQLLGLYARHAVDLIERMRFEQALKDADRKKDEFLATLAHELRNPLAPMRNGLQIMRLTSHNRESVDQARTMMERQLGQMVRLIDDLLDMSRISRGKIELKRERIELSKVVHQAVETSRPLIDASGHNLTIHMPPQPVLVDADATRLAQVFANLLNNAAKYTEKGGRITLTVARQGDDAVVSVRDTGVGIPAPMLPRVFEMFTQVDHSLEKSQGGLGIGLSLVKKLVELHGGTVEAKSDGDGMGSEFIVRLPAAPSLIAEQQNVDGKQEPTATVRRRILVVDDNRDSALSLTMMLKIMGNDAQAAHDGLEAVAAAAAFKPDVILLDIGMPKLNGYDACRRIREQPWAKNVVIVAQTGWGQEEDRRRSQEAGFNFHLVKPVDPAALTKLLAGLQATDSLADA